VKLLLDEHFSPELAQRLREVGHDVVAVVEVAELVGLADPELLAEAVTRGRVLVTENVRDFGPLADRLDLMVPGTGVLFTSHARFPRNQRSLGKLLRALDAWLRARPGDAPAGVGWLDDPPA
jgi:hypothetical protein